MVDESTPITANRLRRPNLLEVLDRFSGLFLVTYTDPETGEQVESDRCDEIRDRLSRAWDEFIQVEDGAAPVSAFTAFLAESGAHADALADVDGIRALLSEIRTMGVTRCEMAACKKGVLGPILEKLKGLIPGS